MTLRWQMVPTFARAMWHAALYVWHRQPIIAPKPVVTFREARCTPCKFNDYGQCRKCNGCFIAAKVLLSSEQCPDVPPRWNRVAWAKPIDTSIN